MKPIELEQLAVMFRVNDPNLGHVSTLETMTEAGLAYQYGLWRGTPWHYRHKRRRMREQIADQLDRKANLMREGHPLSSVRQRYAAVGDY